MRVRGGVKYKATGREEFFAELRKKFKRDPKRHPPEPAAKPLEPVLRQMGLGEYRR
jgi:hypothetical protein